jgi:hypothetical protein
MWEICRWIIVNTSNWLHEIDFSKYSWHNNSSQPHNPFKRINWHNHARESNKMYFDKGSLTRSTTVTEPFTLKSTWFLTFRPVLGFDLKVFSWLRKTTSNWPQRDFSTVEFHGGSWLATSIPARVKQHNLMSCAIGGPQFRRSTEGC